MASKKESWREYFKSRGLRGAIYFLDGYFRYRGIKRPTTEDILKITHEELLDSYIAIPTVKEIMLFQQINRKN